MNFATVIFVFVIFAYCAALLIDLVRKNFAEFRPRRDMKRIITDEEFLAACSTKNPEVALRVRGIISDQLDVPQDTIHPDDRLVQELGCW